MLLSRRDASARNTALIFAVSVIAPTFLGMCLVDAQVDGQAELIGGTELVPADSGGALLCLAAGATPAPTCRVLDSEVLPRGVVVESGCEADGEAGALCRLGCSEGFEISDAADGRCALDASGATAAYEGQAATCRPEMNLDGTMAESYCRLEESEAVRSCCDLGGAPAGTCGTDRPPQSCDLECVEIWLPLVEIGALDGASPTFFFDFLHGALLCNAVLGLCFLGLSPIPTTG